MGDWQEHATDDGVTSHIEYETLTASIHGLGGGDFVEVSRMRLRFAQMDEELEQAEKWWRELHMPIETIPVRNDGAHDEIAFLLDNGAELWAALQYVEMHMPDEPRTAKDEYLGATLGEIMHRDVAVGGSASKGRHREKRARGVSTDERNRRFDAAVMESEVLRRCQERRVA